MSGWKLARDINIVESSFFLFSSTCFPSRPGRHPKPDFKTWIFSLVAHNGFQNIVWGCVIHMVWQQHLSQACLFPLSFARLHLDHLSRLPLAHVQVADPTWQHHRHHCQDHHRDDDHHGHHNYQPQPHHQMLTAHEGLVLLDYGCSGFAVNSSYFCPGFWKNWSFRYRDRCKDDLVVFQIKPTPGQCWWTQFQVLLTAEQCLRWTMIQKRSQTWFVDAYNQCWLPII